MVCDFPQIQGGPQIDLKKKSAGFLESVGENRIHAFMASASPPAAQRSLDGLRR
jgi:hypothetical protein